MRNTKRKTNNYAELKAILEHQNIRLFQYKKFNKDKIVIVTDSKYSINCITQWYHSWIKNNGLVQLVKRLKIKN